MILVVENCARCGLYHAAVNFVSFKRPVVVGAVHEFEYWGVCPTTEEPILMQVVMEDPHSGPVYATRQED